ncbi:MAG: sigma-70 family RNA polymerase sigma factor [Balneolaceae bacterium]
MDSRVDYSELVNTLNSGDELKASVLLKEVIPRLVEYLQVTMSSEYNTARECVQQAMLNVYEQIRKDNIRQPQYIFSYLMRACRNEYINYQKTSKRYTNGDSEFQGMVEPATQIDNLIDEERQKLLKECVNELDEDSRSFMLYFLEHPDSSTKQASRIFKISEANVRTKKSRLIRQLHSMYLVKSTDVIV